MVESIPEGRNRIFAPDQNLGSYIEGRTGLKLIKWKGCCHVHDRVTAAQIEEMKAAHPGVKVLVHPECRPEVVALADVAGSTAAILDACEGDDQEYIVVTENGILWELHRRYPNKRFYPVELVCEYMKMVTLEKVYKALADESPEVVVPQEVAVAAKRSIENMIAIK